MTFAYYCCLSLLLVTVITRLLLTVFVHVCCHDCCWLLLVMTVVMTVADYCCCSWLSFMSVVMTVAVVKFMSLLAYFLIHLVFLDCLLDCPPTLGRARGNKCRLSVYPCAWEGGFRQERGCQEAARRLETNFEGCVSGGNGGCGVRRHNNKRNKQSKQKKQQTTTNNKQQTTIN